VACFSMMRFIAVACFGPAALLLHRCDHPSPLLFIPCFTMSILCDVVSLVGVQWPFQKPVRERVQTSVRLGILLWNVVGMAAAPGPPQGPCVVLVTPVWLSASAMKGTAAVTVP
jgi:hypothetical protein